MPTPDADLGVRAQLDRVLASTTFQQCDRLKRFLSFIVLEAIAGRRNELKEYVIGVQVFGKEDSFDPRTDPIVRVQARRLRAKLVRYYRDEGPVDEVIVELPKGGYAPTFKRRDTPVLVKRSISAALVSRNTVMLQPFTDLSVEHDLNTSAVRGGSSIACRDFRRCGSSRPTPRPRRQANAAMLICGSVRRAGGACITA